jgi:hypothetical protein
MTGGLIRISAGEHMSKLFTLKEWLSVPAAAEHLATVFQEDVAPSDVLRFALDGSLTLSVRFVNKCDALPGQFVPIEDAAYTEIPNPGGTEPHRDYGGYVMDVNGVESHVLTFDGPMTKLQGVYDLPMMGGEKLQVEHEYQRSTDGSPVSELSVNGTYVRNVEGQFFQLHQHFDDDALEDGSAAQGLLLEHFILAKDIGKVQADGFRKSYADKRRAFMANRAATPGIADYSLLPLLPLDAELVVRTTSLAKLLTSANGSQSSADKQLGTKERETLLKLVIGMAIKGYSHDPNASKSKATKEIADDLGNLGIGISDDTVRKYLSEAVATVLPAKSRQS